MSQHYDKVHTETREGFDIALYVTHEDHAPDWDFPSAEDEAETLRKIENGTLLWFVAKVTASKHGVELGCNHLGGCCYESILEFIRPGDYYDDMVSQAIAESKTALAKLCAHNQLD